MQAVDASINAVEVGNRIMTKARCGLEMEQFWGTVIHSWAGQAQEERRGRIWYGKSVFGER